MEIREIFLPALELLHNGNLLSGLRTDLQEKPWHVVTNFSEARTLAWSADEGIEEVWTDLREREAAHVRIEQGWETWNFWETDLSPIFDAYLEKLGWVDISNDVSSDLYYVCCDRYFRSGRPLWDAMFEAYKAGAWPCGWIGGEYPTGRLAVFSAAG